MRTVLLAVVLGLTCCLVRAETPIISVCDRGDLETKSFRIDGPATLTIHASSDSRDIDNAYGVTACLCMARDDEIETEGLWELELRDKRRTYGTDKFRVRVNPGVYFFQVITVLDGVWSVKLHHDNQEDIYTSRKTHRHYEILRDGDLVATAIDADMAKKIVDLLNASNR